MTAELAIAVGIAAFFVLALGVLWVLALIDRRRLRQDTRAVNLLLVLSARHERRLKPGCPQGICIGPYSYAWLIT